MTRRTSAPRTREDLATANLLVLAGVLAIVSFAVGWVQLEDAPTTVRAGHGWIGVLSGVLLFLGGIVGTASIDRTKRRSWAAFELAAVVVLTVFIAVDATGKQAQIAALARSLAHDGVTIGRANSMAHDLLFAGLAHFRYVGLEIAGLAAALALLGAARTFSSTTGLARRSLGSGEQALGAKPRTSLPPRPDTVGGVPVDPSMITAPAARTVVVSGRFRKERVKPIKRYGAYRGDGDLWVEDAGLRVRGRHVRTLGARWLIGLGIFVVCAVVTRGLLAPGFIPLYFLMEYGLLLDGARFIPWDDVVGFAASERKGLVSIATNDQHHLQPLVLRTEHWAALRDALRAHVPHAEVDADRRRAESVH